MFGLVAGLVGGALAPLLDTIATASARLLRKVALFLVAAVCLVVVLIALTIAFDLWIATLAGPIVAALAVAGLYLAVALLAIVLALRDGSQKASAKPSAKQSAKQADAKTAESAKSSGPEINAQIDQFTAPILDLLQRLGLRREQFAVLAGASIAKRLGPLPLVGCAIVAGFLIGRLWKSWRQILDTLVASPIVADFLRPKPAEAATEADV